MEFTVRCCAARQSGAACSYEIRSQSDFPRRSERCKLASATSNEFLSSRFGWLLKIASSSGVGERDVGEVQLLRNAVGNSSGRLSSSREEQRKVSFVERRREGAKGAKLEDGTGLLAKQGRSHSEFQVRRESAEVQQVAKSLPLVLRVNSRHTYDTGSQTDALQHNVLKPPWLRTTLSPGSTSDLGCEHFLRCSGCTVENELDQPPVLQDAVNFFRNHGINEFSLAPSKLWEWRCRAKLAVRGTAENPLIGLFEEGSHFIADIPNCRTHHPRINAAVDLVKEGIRRLGIEPFDEESGLGHLRYIQMVVSTHNTSLPAAERYANGVTLVWNSRDENAPDAKFLQPMVEFLWRRGGARSPRPLLHSVWANFQTTRSNVIFGGKWRHLMGEQEMWEHIAGADICFTPASFGQANLQAFDSLLRKLQKHVKRGSAVVELYAGVGVIGISLAATRACRSVKCVEVNKEAKDSFQLSIARLPDSVNCKISWHCADASVTPINWLEGSEIVIVDPPRKGLDSSIIEALRIASLRGQGKMKSASPLATTKVEKRPWMVRANQGVTKESSRNSDNDSIDVSWPNTLIYVSCGWQSFKEDCAALIEDDAWHLAEGNAFNFFPGTDSIEVLAVFKRGKAEKKARSTKKFPGRRAVPFHRKVTKQAL